jgi:hypothetical protein
MLILSEKELKFISDNLKLIIDEKSKLNDVLIPLDEWIALNGFDENDVLTDEGRKVQKMYDNIYLNNI